MAMESTGVYWKPVHHVLYPEVEVFVANAADVKQRRGKKTDKSDAKWLADLLACDCIQPSFVPPKEICALRDITRTRKAHVASRTQTKNRILALLEDTNIKYSSVMADPFCKSGREMLNALLDGERNPEKLAQLAKGVLRRKIDQLVLALEGCFTKHHALLIKQHLSMLELIEHNIEELEHQAEELYEPFFSQLNQLESIPGVGTRTARVIIAEIGTDMSRFVNSGRLSSWAGMCPGNNESAGKKKVEKLAEVTST